MSITGKTAIVTGGCGGLGAAISEAFLAAGANVVAADINPKLISSFGAAHATESLLAHQCDIASEEAVDGLFAATIAKFGQVDILVNNAGIMDRFEPVGELPRDTWDRVLAVNLTSAYITSNRAVNHMIEKGVKGSILNVSSIAGSHGWAAGSAYTASKWGLTGLTKSMACSYRSHDIRCNAIMPGPMETNIAAHLAEGLSQAGADLMKKQMETMGRKSDLADVAGLVLYLCGSKSVSGACVPIDDAWSAF